MLSIQGGFQHACPHEGKCLWGPIANDLQYVVERNNISQLCFLKLHVDKCDKLSMDFYTTLPETNTSHLKMDAWNTTVISFLGRLGLLVVSWVR